MTDRRGAGRQPFRVSTSSKIGGIGYSSLLVSKDFLTDILANNEGLSFYRFQMVLFTVILAAIFVVKAASNLVMPDFDPTLLGLMGISSGTYLGFKLQGK